MMSKEVPTACFMLSFPKNNKLGMMRNPPPAPNKPDTQPTTKPIILNCIGFTFGASYCSADFRIIETEANIINTENKSNNNKSLEQLNDPMLNK